MPITRCPGCQASLEVPAVVPGGLVSCPYCGNEFPVKSRGGAARAPAGRGRPRGRGRAREDEYEDEGYARRGYRRRTDPMPIIIIVVSVVLIGGVIAYFSTKGKRTRAARHESQLQEIARAEPAYYELPRSPDAPGAETFDLTSNFLDGDRVTISKLTCNSTLTPPEAFRDRERARGLTYDIYTEEGAEKITTGGGDVTHEGTYKFRQLVSDGVPVITQLTEIQARFKTDRRGRLVPGSFMQLGGAPLSPTPDFLASRGFGILPDRPIRHKETWGTNDLPNPFAGRVLIDGRSLENLGLTGQRQGGWRFETGLLSRREDGSWTHEAFLELHLAAVENRRQRNGTFRGEPADISAALSWKGKAFYLLQKGILNQVDQLTVTLKVRVRTRTAIYDWSGISTTNYQMYKDP